MLASQQVFENNPAKDIHLTTSPKCDTYEGSGVGGESHLVRKWTGTVIAPERSFLRDVNESPLRSGSTIDPSIYSLILKCEELHSALLQESRLAQSNSHFCLILSTLDFLTAKHMDRLERELHLLCGCLADATLVSKSLDFYRQLNSLSRDLDQVEVAIAVDEWISMIDDRMSALNCTSQGVVSLPQDPKAFFQAAVGVSHVLDEIDALQKNMERSLALIDENVNYLIRINSAIQK